MQPHILMPNKLVTTKSKKPRRLCQLANQFAKPVAEVAKTMPISRSPDRDTFHIECELKRVEEGEKTAEQAEEMIEFYRSANQLRRDKEQEPEWQKNNMEYDMRSAEWMVAKVRASDAYAQNLYAAMCNREFQKNEVWPQLKGDTWSCSWRYAGGIIADMRGEGDYIDWYCSGISGSVTDEEFQGMSKEAQEAYLYAKNNFVSESVVTDEIRADLFELGWLVVQDSDDV